MTPVLAVPVDRNTHTKKKTLDKSTTENYAALDGIWESSVYGSGTICYRAITASFTAFRSCTNRHSVG